MSDYLEKAEQFAGSHEQQVDEGLDKAAKEAERRTDDRYDPQIDQGVKEVEKHIHDERQ